MFTRRNWLLRCSILINIAVVLYICSHVMIGGGGNFATGPAFITQDDVSKMRQMAYLIEKKDEVKVKEQETPVRDTLLTSSSSSSSSFVKQIPSQKQTQQQQQQTKSKVTEDNSGRNILQDESNIPAQPQFLQQQDQEIANQQKEILESNDEKRFELPTDPNFTIQENKGRGVPSSGGTGNLDGIGGSGSSNIVGGGNGGTAAIAADNEIPIAGQQESVVVTFVNSSNSDNYIATDENLDERLKSILKCHDRDYVPETLQRGDFWVLKNYIRADHGELKCHETITYTTHADYTFLDNLIPLLERWNAPISIALHAPGTDFPPTINSIKYIRDCLPESNLVKQFVTFHIYFSTKHIPKNVPKYDKVLETSYNCSLPAPFVNVTTGQLYKTQKKLLYPVNVGRNIARDSATTYFILASDIELYPNPGLVKKFLEMIARNDANLQRKNPRVFPLSIFEVESSSPVPKDKTELQELLKSGKAIPFHKRVCSSCHGVPKSKEWMAANETEDLGVFHIGKRVGYFVHWEPIYIGTHSDPHYDERLSWEGKSDKMTQGYALCALDYEFHILDNAFLVHKPGIKVLKKDPRRAMLAAKTNQLIKKIIYPELRIMYGMRKGCAV